MSRNGRPPYVPRTEAEGRALRRRVRTDPEVRKLPRAVALALLVALDEWADGAGQWWVLTSTWAEAAGLPQRTLERAVTAARDAGVLVTTPGPRRPDGRQGALNYRLAPRLLEAVEEAEPDRHSRRPGEEAEESPDRHSRSGQTAIPGIARPPRAAERTGRREQVGENPYGSGRRAGARPDAAEEEDSTPEPVPGRTPTPPEERIEPDVSLIAGWLLSVSPPGTDALTPAQLAALSEEWARHPGGYGQDAVEASAWDSRAARNPVACLWARLLDGLLDPAGWSRVVDRWRTAGCPRPWLEAEERRPAGPLPGQLGLGAARPRDAAKPDPFAGQEREQAAEPNLTPAEAASRGLVFGPLADVLADRLPAAGGAA